jgi:hypothetical protein
MERYAYQFFRTPEIKMEDTLNRLGNDGWRCVSVMPHRGWGEELKRRVAGDGLGAHAQASLEIVVRHLEV